MTRERPILFQGAMVRALLSGAKTQTRRVMKPDGQYRLDLVCPADGGPSRCPYGQPGDRLWVRESHWWFPDECDPETGYTPPILTAEDVEYRADGEKPGRVWRPSIHMHRWASRITLEVAGVRVERLQDISEADAQAEGIGEFIGGWACLTDDAPQQAGNTPKKGYRHLWERINGPGSWDVNPWVWVVEFRRIAP